MILNTQVHHTHSVSDGDGSVDGLCFQLYMEETQVSPVKPNDKQTLESINNPWKCNMETGKTRSWR